MNQDKFMPPRFRSASEAGILYPCPLQLVKSIAEGEMFLMSTLSIFLLMGFAITGVTLLAGAVKGNYRLFRHNLVVSGVAIVISALFAYMEITAKTGDDKIFWGLLGLFAQIAACGVSGLFTLAVFLGGKRDGTMSARLRACCLGLAIVLFAGFILVYEQKEIATALQRRAISAGATSPLAERIARDLRYWGTVAQLEPSPQKERLISMIEPTFYPPEEFWEVLLSLPSSPERLAVISTYAHGLRVGKSSIKWLAALYDQGDAEGLEAVFKENEDAYFGYLLADIVASEREDILRDVLRRGSGRIAKEYQSSAMLKAIEADSREMVALLLDNGISPDIRFGQGRPSLGLAIEYNRTEVVRLLLERGADVNADCLVMDAVQYPEVLTQLLADGASPFCTRDGRTLLHQAAWKNANTASMTLLLGLGLPVDAPDNDGRSPLLLAAFVGSSEALNCFVAAGADVSLRDAEGNTALHLAVRSPYLNRESSGINVRDVMARLIELEPALISIRDAEGKTALDYAEDEKTFAILQGEEKK